MLRVAQECLADTEGEVQRFVGRELERGQQQGWRGMWPRRGVRYVRQKGICDYTSAGTM